MIDEDYLFQIIPTKYVKGELLKRAERSLIPSMSVEHLREIKIPLPTMNEQRTIVGKLDKLSAEVKKLEKIYQQKLADLEELKKSVLQKAFNGELVPTPERLSKNVKGKRSGRDFASRGSTGARG